MARSRVFGNGTSVPIPPCDTRGGGVGRVARLVAVLLGLAVLALSWTATAEAATRVDPGSEAGFVARTNGERTSRGIGALTVADDLVAIARQHSQEMASSGRLYHNPNLATQVQNWQAVGENVGTGPSVENVHVAFMNSPHHRANILNTRYTQVGIGVVWSGNALWVTEVFRQPATPRPVATPRAPVAAPRPAPAAASAPAPSSPAPAAAPAPASAPATAAAPAVVAGPTAADSLAAVVAANELSTPTIVLAKTSPVPA